MKSILKFALFFVMSSLGVEASDLQLEEEFQRSCVAKGTYDKSRFEKFVDFHEKEKNKFEELQIISQTYDWQEFTRDLIEKNQDLPNKKIEFLFIRACAENMIASSEYFAGNQVYFLVEALDPVIRNFMD